MGHERIEQFINELNAGMKGNYPQIEDVFNAEYDFPELDPLRDEICKCIICGLYQAAITLTNHLLESSLKKCLAMKYGIDNKNTRLELKDATKEGISNYNSWNLNKTIKEAYEKQLITEEQKNQMHNFREDFRNAYSHADVTKIFSDCCPKVRFISSDEVTTYEDLLKIASEKPETEIRIRDFLPIQGIAQAVFARKDAVPYFVEIDRIIRSMLLKIKAC